MLPADLDHQGIQSEIAEKARRTSPNVPSRMKSKLGRKAPESRQDCLRKRTGKPEGPCPGGQGAIWLPRARTTRDRLQGNPGDLLRPLQNGRPPWPGCRKAGNRALPDAALPGAMSCERQVLQKPVPRRHTGRGDRGFLNHILGHVDAGAFPSLDRGPVPLEALFVVRLAEGQPAKIGPGPSCPGTLDGNGFERSKVLCG